MQGGDRGNKEEIEAEVDDHHRGVQSNAEHVDQSKQEARRAVHEGREGLLRNPQVNPAIKI